MFLSYSLGKIKLRKSSFFSPLYRFFTVFNSQPDILSKIGLSSSVGVLHVEEFEKMRRFPLGPFVFLEDF